MQYDNLVDRAAAFAVEAHAGMLRNDGTPYILHPMEVAVILRTMTEDEDVIAAGLLHDVVEDTPHTMDEILARFGPRVAALVAAETENKRDDLPKRETWQIRKEESLAELRAAEDIGVKMLWLADKLSNMRAFRRFYEVDGPALWKRFHNSDTTRQAWYYRSVADAVSMLRETAAWQEYTALLNQVFADTPTTGGNDR